MFVSLTSSHPELAAEWDDLERSVDSVSAGSKFAAAWRCKTCGHTWHARVQNRAAGRGCPACAGKVPSPTNSASLLPAAILAEWDDTRPPENFTLGSSKPVGWKCVSCGHRWRASVQKRAYGRGCPACSGKVAQPDRSLAALYPALAAELIGDATEVFPGSSKRAQWRCADCSHEWSAIVSNRALKGRGCPACAGHVAVAGSTDLATTHPDLVREIADDTDPTQVKAGSHDRVQWACSQCSSTWVTEIYNRALYGGGCPACYKKTFVSRFEAEVADFIRLYADDVETTVRYIAGVTELDIYIPSLRLGVECQGVYWHSAQAGKGPDYHKRKRDAVTKAGVQLIQVWEDDWRNRRPVVEKMLVHKLHASRLPSVPARKTEAVALTMAQSRAFFEANHLQGHVNASHYFGLRSESGELVAAMSLKRTSSSKVLRLERYATSMRVPGGHSKLVRYAERELPGWESLITFADLEVSDGELYECTGWVREAELAPDYKYVVRGRREHKFGYRLARFRSDPGLKFEEGMSERELAVLNNLPRVWDSGKIRYRYDRAASARSVR